MPKFVIRIFILFVLPLCTSAQNKWNLNDCVQYAEEHNLNIINKQLEKEIKEVDVNMAKSARIPSLGAYLETYSNFGQAQDIFGNTQRNDNINNNFGINSEIILYNQGRLKNQIAKAKTEVELAGYEVELETRLLVIKVIKGYLDILLSKEIVKLSKELVSYAEKQYNKTKITTKAGTTSLTTEYEANANLAREKQKLITAEIEVSRASLRLAQLLLLDDYDSFEIQSDSISDDMIVPHLYDRNNLLEQAYAVQPSILRYEKIIRGIDLENDILRAQFFPTVKAGVILNTTYFNSLVTGNDVHFFRQANEKFAQQAAVSISIPIYNRGLTKGQIAQNQFLRKQMINQKNIDKQLIRQEVENAYYDCLANYQRYLTAKEALNSSNVALKYTQKSYEAGRSSIYDYNNSLSNFAQAQSDLLQSKYAYYFNKRLLDYYISKNP